MIVEPWYRGFAWGAGGAIFFADLRHYRWYHAAFEGVFVGVVIFLAFVVMDLLYDRRNR